MKKIYKSDNVMWKYVIFAYILFWVMVLGLCGTFSMVFNASPLTMRWLSNLCAWSPTIVLIIMFKKLKVNKSLQEFYKDAFSGKISLTLLILSGICVLGGTLLTVFIVSIIEGKSFSGFFSYGMYSLPLLFLLSILSGPTGEESGWRGYLRIELEKRFGFVKGAIVLGLIWAFWHTVLWFVDCNFSGFNFIIYIISNVIVMTSLSVIMNTVLKKSNNLVYAVWIHFCFNFLYSFISTDIIFYIVLSIVYAIIAFFYILMYFKKLKDKV